MSDVAGLNPLLQRGDFRIGDAFGKTFGIFGRHIVTFMVLATIAHIPRLLLAVLYRRPSVLPGQFSVQELWTWIAITNVVLIICSSLTSAMVVYGVIQDLRGQSFSIQGCIQTALSRLMPLLGIAICVGLATFIGGILLVVPGLIVATIYYVAQPACIAENRGVFDSMSRSSALSKGFRWKIFAVFLLVLLAAMIIGGIIGLIFGAAGPAAVQIASLAVEIIVGAFSATLVGVVYYLLRVAKDGVDIEKIASVFE